MWIQVIAVEIASCLTTKALPDSLLWNTILSIPLPMWAWRILLLTEMIHWWSWEEILTQWKEDRLEGKGRVKKVVTTMLCLSLHATLILGWNVLNWFMDYAKPNEGICITHLTKEKLLTKRPGTRLPSPSQMEDNLFFRVQPFWLTIHQLCRACLAVSFFKTNSSNCVFLNNDTNCGDRKEMKSPLSNIEIKHWL